MTTVKTATYNSKAIRVADQLIEDVRRGRFAIGALLPTEDKLAQEYDVSRMPMRKSLEILYRRRELQKLSHGGALATSVTSAPANDRAETKLNRPQTDRKLAIAAVMAAEPYYCITQRLEGARKYANEHGLRFSHFLSSRHEDALNVLSRVEEHALDGVLVTPFLDDRYISVLKSLIEKKFPVVLNNTLGDLPISTVMSSDGVGAYQATCYLIEKYHRPVYYICSPADKEITTERHQGYANAMKDAGFESRIDEHICRMDIPANDPAYWSTDKNWLPAFYAADRLFSKLQPPVSIFCENDFDARGVYEAAGRHHLVVGKDVAVVGFDDYPLAKLIKPSLTTCHAFTQDLGYEDARLLHRIIMKEVQPPVHIRLPMELIIRESA